MLRVLPEMAARGQVAESDKDDVLKLLQATLISSKAGVPLEKLNRKSNILHLKHQSHFLSVTKFLQLTVLKSREIVRLREW